MFVYADCHYTLLVFHISFEDIFNYVTLRAWCLSVLVFSFTNFQVNLCSATLAAYNDLAGLRKAQFEDAAKSSSSAILQVLMTIPAV
jgi:hypothetical protein